MDKSKDSICSHNSNIDPECIQAESNIHNVTSNIEGTLPVLFSVLSENQVIPIMPKGTSMCPFFLGGRDTLYLKCPVFPLKRGDIALYQRKDKTFIVHRIHHITASANGNLYYFLGDNQTWIEGPILESQILGVTSYFTRKGKKIDCTSSKKYNLLWRFWMIVRPLRPIFTQILNSLRNFLKTKHFYK